MRAVMDTTSDIRINVATDAVTVQGLTEEKDPTIPHWAKSPEKPTYTAEEVGALPDNTFIPNKVSELENDSHYLTEESDPTVPGWAKTPEKPNYTASEVGALPEGTFIPTELSELTSDSEHRTVTDAEKEIWNKGGGTRDYNDLINTPTKLSDFANDEGFITGYTETDPTVPAWAKAPNKPSYTASEVGALPSTAHIPTKVSELYNDSGFITNYTETDPTVPAWAKESSKPTYTASEVGALPSTTFIPSTAADIGALPDTTVIPSKTSDLTNDSNFISEEDVSAVTPEDVRKMWEGTYGK